jgi:hypothetical protein
MLELKYKSDEFLHLAPKHDRDLNSADEAFANDT